MVQWKSSNSKRFSNGRLQAFKADVSRDDVDEDGIALPEFHYGSKGEGERNLKFARKIAQHPSEYILAVCDGSNNRAVLLNIDERLGNHIDVTIPDEIENRGWYSFPDHRTMFDMQVRYAYHYGNIDPTSANELASKSLNFVVRQIRTLPNEDRINIPWISHMKITEPITIDNVIYSMGCVIGVDGSLGISNPKGYWTSTTSKSKSDAFL